MGQEKSEKSKLPDQYFPGGLWPIYIRGNGDPIGSLRIDYDPESIPHYLGEMKFAEHDQFGPISDQGYNVKVCISDDIPGTISFHILGAAQAYDSHTDPRYGFVFAGFYEGTEIVLNGLAKVPKGFDGSGGPGDEGDTVTWTSQPRDDSQPEPSK